MLSKSPFTLFSYLTHIQDPRLACNLLLRHSQNSTIPSQLPSTHSRDTQNHSRQAGRHDWFYYTSTKCAIPDDMAGQQQQIQCIPFTKCFCPCCIPLCTNWGLTKPATGSPIGSPHSMRSMGGGFIFHNQGPSLKVHHCPYYFNAPLQKSTRSNYPLT
jgi:hypothetical protein